MTEVSKLALIMDPEQVQHEFGKKDIIRSKIQQLQGPVFKMYASRRSKSIFHSNPTPAREVPQPQQPKNVGSPAQRARVKNIQFRVSSCRSEGSTRRSHHTFNPRVASSFSPRVGMHPSRAIPPMCQKEMESRIGLLEKSKLQGPLTQKMRQGELRDSQTLLRKNSLYLVNCLTSRYKDRELINPHIGQMTNATNQKRLTQFAEKAQSLTHYSQRFEYMEQAKQRLLQAKDPSKTHRPRLTHQVSVSIRPEPWEEPLSPTPF